MLVLYGLGTTIGAGIYALVGELAGKSGYLAPLAFLVASLLAALTALSFAELSGRYPRAAGAALYTQQGFGSRHLALLVGLAVALAGIVSSAALINAFVLQTGLFVGLNPMLMTVLVAGSLFLIAAWGIAESVRLAAFITLLEIGGLLAVIAVSGDALRQFPEQFPKLLPGASWYDVNAIFAGVLLGFYAFIGFEDMVDVAEEVKDVKRNLPLAIILTLLVTTVLYCLIMSAAVMALPLDRLAESKAPLALVFSSQSGLDPLPISLIGIVAIINGALIQIIMASRVLYGLACRAQLPAVLATVNPRTRTPVFATSLVSAIVLTFALLGGLASLAEATSIIMLSVFALVNLALFRIKGREPNAFGVLLFPRWVPALGFVFSTGFVMARLF